MSLQAVKRLGRYRKGRKRVVYVYKWQELAEIDVSVYGVNHYRFHGTPKQILGFIVFPRDVFRAPRDAFEFPRDALPFSRDGAGAPRGASQSGPR